MGNERNGYECVSARKDNGRTLVWRIGGANYEESENIHASLKPYNGRTPNDNVRIASDNAYNRRMALVVTYQRQELGPRLVRGMDPAKDILAEELILAGWNPSQKPGPMPACRTEGASTESP